jgi:hypothetical protein
MPSIRRHHRSRWTENGERKHRSRGKEEEYDDRATKLGNVRSNRRGSGGAKIINARIKRERRRQTGREGKEPRRLLVWKKMHGFLFLRIVVASSRAPVNVTTVGSGRRSDMMLQTCMNKNAEVVCGVRQPYYVLRGHHQDRDIEMYNWI